MSYEYTTTDPAYERDEHEDDSAFTEQDKPVRPDSRQMAGAIVALHQARRQYMKEAADAETLREGLSDFWLARAADTLVAIEWLERGAP